MSDPRINKRTSRNVQRIANSLDNQMAYSRRSSYGSYRRYGRRYSSYGRSAKRRSFGQFRAANQQTDCSRQVLKWSSQHTLTIAANSNQGSTYFQAWKALENSGFYNNFAQMYDQIKMNAVRVKITLLSAASAIYSTTNNPVFVSAWDRNGGSRDSSAGSTLLTSFNLISSYGSAQTRPLTQGANFGVMRTLYASSMEEKSQYVPTSSLPTASSDDGIQGDIYKQVAFRPILFLGIYSQTKDTAQQQSLVFNVEWQFDVTFRGTRNDPNATTV